MSIESGWLGLLKASGWQLLGLSVGLTGFWLLLRYEVIPPTDLAAVVYGLPLAVLVTGGLGLASLVEKSMKLVSTALAERKAQREVAEKKVRHQQEFVDYIPFMNASEKAIFGYLLEHNRKSFTADDSAGNGAVLYKRGYLRCDVVHGRSYDMISGVPFSVPDHIWEKLEENRDAFPKKHSHGTLPWFR